MLGVTFALVLFSAPAFATGPVEGNFGGNGKAWTEDYSMHYVNNNNPANRKDWANHRFAQPGQGGAHANEHSAVQAHGDGTLVDPQSTL